MTDYTDTLVKSEEAVAAWIRGERVEFFDAMLKAWLPLLGEHQLGMFATDTLFRIRREAPQGAVEEALTNVLSATVGERKWLDAWLRVFAALKREILEEVRK